MTAHIPQEQKQEADSIEALMSRLERTANHDWPFLDKLHKALHRESLGAINWLTEKQAEAEREARENINRIGFWKAQNASLEQQVERLQREVAFWKDTAEKRLQEIVAHQKERDALRAALKAYVDFDSAGERIRGLDECDRNARAVLAAHREGE